MKDPTVFQQENTSPTPFLEQCIYHSNSLFLASSHNFISSHFCIKYLKIPTYIEMITQEKFEHKLLPNANLTMALPFLAPLLVPQFPEKKITQRTLLSGRVAPPTHAHVTGNDHFHGNTYVPPHMPRVKIKPNGNKKKSNTINSKKKTGKAKHGAFPKVQDGCKESVQLACSLQIQELRDLIDGHCSGVLSQIPADEFTTCCFEWGQYYEDPEPVVKRGKKVEVSANGTVKFLDAVGMEPKLDLNWCHLRKMARPIIDEAIGRLAMSGLWEKSPMMLQLGSLLVDNKRVRIDKDSYFDMLNHRRS
jgi:hypothetical protein